MLRVTLITPCHSPSFIGSTYSTPFQITKKHFQNSSCKWHCNKLQSSATSTKSIFKIQFTSARNSTPLPDYQNKNKKTKFIFRFYKLQTTSESTSPKTVLRFGSQVIQIVHHSHITKRHFLNSVYKFFKLQTSHISPKNILKFSLTGFRTLVQPTSPKAFSKFSLQVL